MSEVGGSARKEESRDREEHHSSINNRESLYAIDDSPDKLNEKLV